jgi:hypothetical protein
LTLRATAISERVRYRFSVLTDKHIHLR